MEQTPNGHIDGTFVDILRCKSCLQQPCGTKGLALENRFADTMIVINPTLSMTCRRFFSQSMRQASLFDNNCINS